MQWSWPVLTMHSPLDTFLNFGNLLYYFFGGPGCTRVLPRNFSFFSFRFSSPLNLFASSPLRLLALRKPLFFLFAGFAEFLSWFACFCQDSINVSAIWLLWRCYFAVISQKSMNVSANLLTFRFSTNVSSNFLVFYCWYYEGNVNNSFNLVHISTVIFTFRFFDFSAALLPLFCYFFLLLPNPPKRIASAQFLPSPS